jgi:hypothetical protein
VSAEDWLRAAKAEEQRLLGEIVKTELYKQLEAVRAVLAVYPDASPTTAPLQPGAAATPPRGNGAISERSFKVANAFADMTDGAADGAGRARAQ